MEHLSVKLGVPFWFIYMKKIQLTKGVFTKVDDDDYVWAKEVKWYASGRSPNFYAVNNNLRSNGLNRILHREIMRCPKNMVVDHINGDTLDNRKNNLRICLHKENCKNQKIRKNNTSGIKGVYFSTEKRKWYSKIMLEYKTIHLGYFLTKQQALKERVKKEKEYFKEFYRP